MAAAVARVEPGDRPGGTSVVEDAVAVAAMRQDALGMDVGPCGQSADPCLCAMEYVQKPLATPPAASGKLRGCFGRFAGNTVRM